MYQSIKLEKKEEVAILSLARPEKRNAVSDLMRSEIIKALTDLTEDSQIKVVVLTGEGKSFCAGRDTEDLKAIVSMPMDRVHADNLELKTLTDSLRNFTKPIIAAVNGHAMGLGCCLITFCDLVVAGETAKFGFPEINLGIVPGISSVILARTVRRRALLELVLLGDRYTAQEAVSLGLINKVVPDDGVMVQALAWANKLAANDSTMLLLTKRWLATLGEGSYEQEASSALNTMGVAFINRNKR